MLITHTIFSSPLLMDMILPNKKLLKFVPFFTNPDKIPASPIPVDIIMEIAISEYLGIFLRIASTPNAANRQIPIAPKIGLIPSSSPSATPASDAWESASPIIDILFKTIVIPINGVIRASKIPVINACH